MADPIVTVPPKKWWQSKTAWTNLLVGGLAVFFPETFAEVLTPGNAAMLITFVNLVLRMLTKDGIAKQIV